MFYRSRIKFSMTVAGRFFVEMAVFRWEGGFFSAKNPFPEALEGNRFAKKHWHFDRSLDATLRVQ
jgi:hypothetical protein